ncbi:molecular chaperone TorD family protein, partial [Vibrio cholerae O1]|nr:molecular chaperone TorD family protein [Vibrio cholerae O1]
LVAFRNVMMTFSLSEIKAIYTDTFDFTKKAPLYMTYNKFDTQKERGQMLAKLKVLYEMFGLEMVDNELSDYLPLMLQFLQVA